MLTVWSPANPPDGASCRVRIASFVRLVKYVKSRLKRSKSPASKPASHSVPRSGLRSGFPSEPGVTPGKPLARGALVTVRNATNELGCWPDCPYAVRSFKALTTLPKPLQNDSSLITHAALTFG